MFKLLSAFMTLTFAAGIAIPSLAFGEEPITCGAYQTEAGHTEIISMVSSVSPFDELNFTGSSAKYNFTIIFQPPDYEAYWALIETLPNFKPAVHGEGSFSPRPRDPTQKIAVLQFYDDTIDVKLHCTKEAGRK